MDIDLLMLDDTPDAAAVAYFGGLPPIPAGLAFDWPHCSHCEGPLQYLGRVPHPVDSSKRLLIFQCANDPGMCDEWEPEAGGNKVLVVAAAADAQFAQPPSKGESIFHRAWRAIRRYGQPPSAYVTTLETAWSGHSEICAADSYGDAVAKFDQPDDQRRQVLGQLGGRPDWIQEDETPVCPACGQPMVLAAQLEEGPDPETAMNFGGGWAYVFTCPCPADEARFLSQC